MRFLTCLVALLCFLHAAGASGASTTCASLTGAKGGCAPCAARAGCAWCAHDAAAPWGEGACIDIGAAANASACASRALCAGKECADLVCEEPCTNEIWPCSRTVWGELMLMVVYGAILAGGATIISDGSEILLDLFPKWATVIGGLFLPVLGAIPDAAIIVISGALGTKEVAQEQVAIGMGTLAGSTIMLLTVTWSLAMLFARCDLNEFGEARDKVCNGFSLTKQGITVDADTPTNAKIMIGTSLSFLVVQGVAFGYLKDPSKGQHLEKPFTLAGFILCTVLLIAYCAYQLLVPKLAAKRAASHEKAMEEKRHVLRALHALEKMQAVVRVAKATPEASPAPVSKETQEAKARGVGMMWRAKAAAKKGSESDTASRESEPLLAPAAHNTVQEEESDDEEENDAEDIQAHFGKYLAKSLIMMVGGTAICAIFSDPMVSTIGDFSKTLNIPAFYVSFLVTPYCSNASELISSLQFASKKKRENASLTWSQVYGAATMNNTMCLSIFFALVYFRDLTWTFSAETLSILLVTWFVGAIAFRAQTFKVFWAIPIFIMYPLSIAFVYILEKYAGWT